MSSDEIGPDGVPSLTEPAPEAALERARYVAELMDSAFTIPGTDVDVGLDPILGILPAYGDVASGLVSLYIVAEAARAGVPKGKLARMLLNVGVDVTVGSIPVLGTVFDAFWKANVWNVEKIEEHLAMATSGGDEWRTDESTDDAVTIDLDEDADADADGDEDGEQ
jgi:hypothetical protein